MRSNPACPIEEEARRLLADRLEKMPWWPGMAATLRRSAIQADVDQFWKVMLPEAGEAVAARQRGQRGGVGSGPELAKQRFGDWPTNGGFVRC